MQVLFEISNKYYWNSVLEVLWAHSIMHLYLFGQVSLLLPADDKNEKPFNVFAGFFNFEKIQKYKLLESAKT